MPIIRVSSLTLVLGLGAALAEAQGVGFRDVAVDTDGERMPVAVWYPTEEPSGQMTVGPFEMTATRGAPLGSGQYGLVLLSHGLGGGRFNHRDTATILAANGYLVAAPEHSGDNYRDSKYSGTVANFSRRPQQLSAVLDRILADSDFGKRIDTERIAAVGHSIGGYTVLALVGGRPDVATVTNHCAERREQDPEFCDAGRPDPGPVGAFPDVADRREAAAVAVAPVGAVFGESAFDDVDARVQIHRFEADRVLRSPWHAKHIVSLMGARASMVEHPEAHHFAFITPFPPAAGDTGAAGRDPAGFDRSAFLGALNEQIVDFLDDALPRDRSV